MSPRIVCVIGCDPGPVTGLAVAYWDEDSWHYPEAYQCHSSCAVALAAWLAEKNQRLKTVAGVEKFLDGTGPGARGAQASVTRQLVYDLCRALGERGISVKARSASEVKPWATDKRLERAGLAAVSTALPHARDAQRHLLFAGVKDLHVPDPLSRAHEDGYRIRAVPESIPGRHNGTGGEPGGHGPADLKNRPGL